MDDRIDLALHITNEPDASLMARKPTVCRTVVCAAPAYLARHGMPQALEDLAQHNCLTYSRFEKSQWNFRRNGLDASVQVAGNLSANEAMALIQAVRSGCGLSLQPTYSVAPMLKTGELVAVLPDWQPMPLGVYGMYVSRRHQPAALRTLLDFLAARFSREPAWDR